MQEHPNTTNFNTNCTIRSDYKSIFINVILIYLSTLTYLYFPFKLLIIEISCISIKMQELHNIYVMPNDRNNE
jgi:uncharacterized membrane protein